MNEDVQYKQGRSSVLTQRVLLKHKFQMNESLLLLIYQVKMVSSL